MICVPEYPPQCGGQRNGASSSTFMGLQGSNSGPWCEPQVLCLLTHLIFSVSEVIMNSHKTGIKIKNLGVGGVAWLKACIDFAEDLNAASSTHDRWLTATSPGLQEDRQTHLTCTGLKKIKNKNKSFLNQKFRPGSVVIQT